MNPTKLIDRVSVAPIGAASLSRMNLKHTNYLIISR